MSSTRGDWRESLGRELTVRPVVHGCTAADVHSETQAEGHTPPCHHAMDLSLSPRESLFPCHGGVTLQTWKTGVPGAPVAFAYYVHSVRKGNKFPAKEGCLLPLRSGFPVRLRQPEMRGSARQMAFFWSYHSGQFAQPPGWARLG